MQYDHDFACKPFVDMTDDEKEIVFRTELQRLDDMQLNAIDYLSAKLMLINSLYPPTEEDRKRHKDLLSRPVPQDVMRLVQRAHINN